MEFKNVLSRRTLSSVICLLTTRHVPGCDFCYKEMLEALFGKDVNIIRKFFEGYALYFVKSSEFQLNHLLPLEFRAVYYLSRAFCRVE